MMRMTVDCLMTVILLLLMGYSRVGEAAHKWLGISMFLLYIILGPGDPYALRILELHPDVSAPWAALDHDRKNGLKETAKG